MQQQSSGGKLATRESDPAGQHPKRLAGPPDHQHRSLGSQVARRGWPILVIALVALTATLVLYRGRAPMHLAPAEPPGEACGGTSGHACQLSFLATEPDDGVEPLLARFGEAKTSIDYVPFTLDDPRINQALSQARARGVHVRVMLEPQPSDDVRLGSRAESALGKLGIEWKESNPAFNLTHAKYAVIDGSRVLMLTFNSTAADLATRRDFAVVDDDADHARFLQSLFDADWNRTATPPIPTGFVVSPDNSNEALVAFVGSAQRSLDVYAERLDPSPLLDAIVKAARRGVLVRVLAAPLDPKDRAAAKLEDVLRGGNFELEVPRTPRVHAKVMIVDGTRVFLGSENVEDGPKERRREVGMIFEDGAIASRLLGIFERDWAEAGPAPR